MHFHVFLLTAYTQCWGSKQKQLISFW